MNLELERLKLELLKVGAAKAELQFKIYERQADIVRIEEQIKISENRESELKTLIQRIEK